MIGRCKIEVPCTVEIEQTADSFHVHAIPEDIEIRPGDTVILRNAPTNIAFGDRGTFSCRAVVYRAGPLERIWTRISGVFELTDLYEVGFQPKETP